MNLELSYAAAAVASALFGLSSVGLHLLKVSIILGLGFLGDRLMQRSSSAQRHYLWSITLGSVLVLTVLTIVVPPLENRLPANALVGSVLRTLPVEKTSMSSEGSERWNGSYPTAGTLRAPLLDLSRDDNRTRQVIKIRRSDAAFLPTNVSNTFARNIWSVVWLMALVWFFGAVFLLARLANSHRKLARLVRSAEQSIDPEVLDCTQQIATHLRLRRTPRVLLHAGVDVPCMAGWLRPIVLLPTSSREWPNTQLYSVLLHEFAHVSRRDYLTQLMATVTCALYWFHPAVWVAARRLRNACEGAADDCAIATIPSAQYAKHLLAIAESASGKVPTPLAALGMAHTSQLEWRIRAMLNTGVSRRVFEKGTRRVMNMSALFMLIPVAATRLGGGVERERLHPPIENVHYFDRVSVMNHTVTEPVQRLSDAEAATDSIIDRTIRIGSTRNLNLNVGITGDFIFHPSSDATVRVRATIPKGRAIGAEIKLTPWIDGVAFYATGTGRLSEGTKNARYEIWLPSNMRLYVPPSSSNTIRELKLMGINQVAGFKNLEIDGPASDICVNVILAHIAGNLHGRITCALYEFPQKRYSRLNVLVNGKAIADTVDVFNQSTANAPGFEKVIWDRLSLTQFDPDSVSMTVGTSKAMLFRVTGGATSPRSSPTRRAK